MSGVVTENSNQKVENSTQREAFELYYQLGDKRSYKAVAKQFGKCDRTIAIWAKEFGWQGRVIQRTVEESEGEEKKAAQLDVKSRYRNLFNSLLVEAVKDFNAGKLKIKNVSDLERIAKMDLALIDSPIDGIQGEAKLEPEDKEAIDNLIKEVKKGLNRLRK